MPIDNALERKIWLQYHDMVEVRHACLSILSLKRIPNKSKDSSQNLKKKWDKTASWFDNIDRKQRDDNLLNVCERSYN